MEVQKKNTPSKNTSLKKTSFKVRKKKRKTTTQQQCLYCEKKYKQFASLKKHMANCSKNCNLKKPAFPVPMLDKETINSSTIEYMDENSRRLFDPFPIITTQVQEKLKYINQQITEDQTLFKRELNNLYRKVENMEEERIKSNIKIKNLDTEIKTLKKSEGGLKEFLTNIALSILRFTGSHNVEDELIQ